MFLFILEARAETRIKTGCDVTHNTPVGILLVFPTVSNPERGHVNAETNFNVKIDHQRVFYMRTGTPPYIFLWFLFCSDLLPLYKDVYS